MRVAFCEQNSPNLRDVLADAGRGAVVVPLLLADAYHARVDIPAMIAESGADARQADVLGEDDRLIQCCASGLTQAGVSRLDPDVGVLVTAVGSSTPAANARTATVAHDYLALHTRWTAAHAPSPPGPTRLWPRPPSCCASRGATPPGHRALVPGARPDHRPRRRITPRTRIPMAAPLGAHRLVAETVLDRFDEAVAARAAA